MYELGLSHQSVVGGVEPARWEMLEGLMPQRFAIGLIPRWLASVSEEEAELQLDRMTAWVSRSVALESGLDFRPRFRNSAMDIQIDFFEKHLEFCHAFDKPIVVHVNQSSEFVIRVLDMFGVPKKKGICLMQQESPSAVQALVHRGFSIGLKLPPPMAGRRKWARLLPSVPREQLLFYHRYGDGVEKAVIEPPQEWLKMNDDNPDEFQSVMDFNLSRLIEQWRKS